MDFSRFDYGVVHEDQRARLGIGITDINGERWGYIRIREAMSFGQVVRSSLHTDLVTTNPGEVLANAPVGSDKLTTTNGFQLSNVTQDLRGAIGYISAGSGAGQQFYILENNDDTAKVFVLTGSTNRNQNKGWVTELNNTSRFLLFFPGEGRQGDGATDLVEGIIQTNTTSADIGKFCWVKRSGVTACLADFDGTDIAAGGIVIPTAGGLVAGSTDSPAGIGQGLAATTGLEANALALVNLNIPDGPLSYAYANVTNGYNQVTIR